ncbi:MAG: hypothetical protein ACFFDN_02430 [Candidatus Hodarchaeota archaeon]
MINLLVIIYLLGIIITGVTCYAIEKGKGNFRSAGFGDFLAGTCIGLVWPIILILFFLYLIIVVFLYEKCIELLIVKLKLFLKK